MVMFIGDSGEGGAAADGEEAAVKRCADQGRRRGEKRDGRKRGRKCEKEEKDSDRQTARDRQTDI